MVTENVAVNWLLDSGDHWIRYLTWTDVLGQPWTCGDAAARLFSKFSSSAWGERVVSKPLYMLNMNGLTKSWENNAGSNGENERRTDRRIPQ